MKQSSKGERKERLVAILMYGWATSKDPDMLLLARGLPEAKMPNLSCRFDAGLRQIKAISPLRLRGQVTAWAIGFAA